MSGAASQVTNKKKRKPKQPGKTSKYVGIYKLREKFIAQIKHNRKTHYLGIFNHEVNAAIAYDQGLASLMQNNIIPDDATWNAKFIFGDPRLPTTADVVAAAKASAGILDYEPSPKNNFAANQSNSTTNSKHVILKEKCGNSSGYSGITIYKNRNIWKSTIQYNKHKYYIGASHTITEAISKYNRKIEELANQFNDPELLNKRHPVPSTPYEGLLPQKIKHPSIKSTPTATDKINDMEIQQAPSIAPEDELDLLARELFSSPSPLILDGYNAHQVSDFFADFVNKSTDITLDLDLDLDLELLEFAVDPPLKKRYSL